MAWAGSDRASRLPSDWKQRVNRVWERDLGVCTWRLPSGRRCPRKGADVDHIRNDDNHELSNLRLLCRHHHDKKTQWESWQGKARKKSKMRDEERHPLG